MAALFGCTTDNISQHLKRIFAEGELIKESVTEKISATALDGKKYLTQFYNLDATISVGYCVNSQRATHFRKWATGVLKTRLKKSQPELTTRCSQLKMTAADGKRYLTDCHEEVPHTHARRAFLKRVNWTNKWLFPKWK